MKKIQYIIIALLCTMVQSVWAQAPTPSTELEQYLTMSNRMVYRFYYPSTSVTGEPVVLSSLLACWAPSAPEAGDAIESVHMYSHYTVTANSQCPTNSTILSADFIALSILFEGGQFVTSQPFRSVVKRSIVIMPDYEGYGVTVDRTHPYLAEEVTAQQVVDAVTIGEKTYPAPDNMNEMFFEQKVPGMIWGTTTVAWAMLDKIFTSDFYNYMKNPANLTSAPAMTGDAYEDMRYALEANNVCTGWQPKHRIQNEECYLRPAGPSTQWCPQQKRNID